MEAVRGVVSVVMRSDLEVGGFYLDPGYGRGTTLFQWVRTGETREGSPVEAMLVFASDLSELLELRELATHGPLLKMPPVAVRVDPPSANGTALSQSFTGGMLVMEGDRAVLAARRGYHGWVAIDLLTGLPSRLSSQWVRFDRWSLVVDEAGEEIAIASFGEPQDE